MYLIQNVSPQGSSGLRGIEGIRLLSFKFFQICTLYRNEQIISNFSTYWGLYSCVKTNHKRTNKHTKELISISCNISVIHTGNDMSRIWNYLQWMHFHSTVTSEKSGIGMFSEVNTFTIQLRCHPHLLQVGHITIGEVSWQLGSHPRNFPDKTFPPFTMESFWLKGIAEVFE